MMDVLPHEKQIAECKEMISQLKKKSLNSHPVWTQEELHRLEDKLETLKKKVYKNLSPWERVSICRHPARPRTIDYIENICEDFVELHGDRTFSDDHAVIGGLGKIGGQRFMIIGQEKGKDTESRIHRNFGMVHPEGFRKARRLMQMAEKFNLPVLSLIDTPGAFPGLSAEERGQGLTIAENIPAKTAILQVIFCFSIIFT